VQNIVQQRLVNVDDLIVVINPIEPAELVHEEADPRSGRANHFGKRLLVESNGDDRWSAFFSIISEK
jgi:hypothetical protein